MSYWKLQCWRIWAVLRTWDQVMKTGFTTKSKTMSALVLQWPLAVPGTQKVGIAQQGTTRTTNSVMHRDPTARSMPEVASSKIWSMVHMGTVLELFLNTVLDIRISLEIQVHPFLTICRCYKMQILLMSKQELVIWVLVDISAYDLIKIINVPLFFR